MKKLFFALCVLLLPLSIFAQAESENDGNSVTVYAYDVFTGEWGAGPELIPLFEEETGIKVNLITAGGATEMLSRVIAEGEGTEADVVLGISDDMADKAYDADIFAPYESKYLSEIDDELEFDKEHRLLPFDWGAYAFVFDTESGITPPGSLGDLTKSEYKDNLILVDPRTSDVGLGLLLWSHEVFGDEYLSWWKEVSKNALTIADGWSSAYGLFTEGEAPIVLSYTTSPVYHVMNENSTRYKALVFPEGHHGTIEGIGISKYAKNRENAEAFVDFILSEGQATMAVKNSMYPANGNTELPDAYEYAPLPEKLLRTTDEEMAAKDDMLDSWAEAMI